MPAPQWWGPEGSGQGSDMERPPLTKQPHVLSPFLSPSAVTAVSQVTDTGRCLHTSPRRSHLPHSVPRPLSLPCLLSSLCQELAQFPLPSSWHPPHNKIEQQEMDGRHPWPRMSSPVTALTWMLGADNTVLLGPEAACTETSETWQGGGPQPPDSL